MFPSRMRSRAEDDKRTAATDSQAIAMACLSRRMAESTGRAAWCRNREERGEPSERSSTKDTRVAIVAASSVFPLLAGFWVSARIQKRASCRFKMQPHEVATIRAFIIPPRRTRWLESLASAKRRGRFLDRLNHCRDLDERYATPLASNADVVALLKARGAPKICYVLSATAALDGRELALEEAVIQAPLNGWCPPCRNVGRLKD